MLIYIKIIIFFRAYSVCLWHLFVNLFISIVHKVSFSAAPSWTCALSPALPLTWSFRLLCAFCTLFQFNYFGVSELRNENMTNFGGCKKKQWPSDLVVLNVDRCTLQFNIYNSQIKWNVSEILSWNPRQWITRVVFLISFDKICIYRLGESACPSRGFPRFLFFLRLFFSGGDVQKITTQFA